MFCAQQSRRAFVCKGCFRFTVYFLFLVTKGFENVRKTKRLNEEEVKQQLIDSLVNNETIETEELNERAEKVDKPENATNIIKEYEEILCTKRKSIITVAYHQGKVFSRFREKEKFLRLVSRFEIHKNTIVFKINIFQLIQKHPRLIKSSVNLSFLKNYLKDIRQICQKNVEEFE